MIFLYFPNLLFDASGGGVLLDGDILKGERLIATVNTEY